jgi:hypothetical protein
VARPLRLCFADARYQVIVRSTSDGVLFADDLDRESFFAGLDRVVGRHYSTVSRRLAREEAVLAGETLGAES